MSEPTRPPTAPPPPVPRGEVLWKPPVDASTRTEIGRFARWLAERGIGTFADYRSLWEWSVRDLEAFWGAVAAWAPLRWHDRPERVLAGGEASVPGAAWFPGGTLNYAEHALTHLRFRPDVDAVVALSQTRPRVRLGWQELADQVARCRAGLRRLGVGRGDRVVAYLPNIPETLVAFLATASLGAVWSSCAPEFGTRAVVDRFGQIGPSVLLAVDGYRYGTKVIDRSAEVAAITAALPSLRHVVRVPYLQEVGALEEGGGEGTWASLLAGAEPLAFDPVPFDHPLYVLFSSGTTGLPKPITHGHGGITIEHVKTLRLHHDLGPGDRFAWFTTTGWMMWNFLVSGLLAGATVVMFDGDPGHPDLSALWAFAASERLQVFGASAPFLMACRKVGLHPGAQFDLSALRAVGSTGAPLPAEGFRWVASHVSPTAQLASISGGTDVCSAFVGMAPTVAVRAGEISVPLLGCDVRALRPDGTGCPPGEQGELVLAAPLPSMPVGFWGDTDGSRYRAAYFEDFPGYWRHGDWITIHEDGGSVISGRSDATLNRGGVRLGTSDFYAVVEGFPEIADSLVVHLDEPDGSLLLFVSLAAGATLDDDLRARLRAALRTDLSPRHVPDRIEAVPVVPRTLSGKKLEVPVKRILTGTPADRAASRGSLADPGALAYFEALARSSPSAPESA